MTFGLGGGVTARSLPPSGEERVAVWYSTSNRIMSSWLDEASWSRWEVRLIPLRARTAIVLLLAGVGRSTDVNIAACREVLGGAA